MTEIRGRVEMRNPACHARVDAMVTPDSKLPFAPHFTAKA